MFLGAGPRLVDRAPGRLVLWAAVGGVAFDVGVRGGFANLVVALGFAVVVAALVTDGRLSRPQARWIAASALLPAAALGLRASPWLTATNLLAVGGLLTAAILLSRSGSMFDTTPGRLLRRSFSATGRVFFVPSVFVPLLAKARSGSTKQAGRVVVGVLVAGPLLLAVGALLAAADPVFKSLVAPDVDVVPAVEHLAVAGFFAVIVLFVVVSALGDNDDGDHRGAFGAVEVATMLGLAAAVLGLFVVSQLVALTSAGDRLVEAAGLTPAEYARSGFFQLCWATALIVGFLALVGFLAAPEVMALPLVRRLAAAVPFVTVGLVAVSLRRMALYDEVFGLTMLRLWVVGAAVWMGAVLVMIGARNLGVGGGRHWVVGGAGIAALVLVVLADLGDPESFVVRHNVERAASEDGPPLDLQYLTGLSDDAVPALVDELGPGAFTVEPDQYAVYDGNRAMRCHDETTGVAALNLSVARAAEARDDTC